MGNSQPFSYSDDKQKCDCKCSCHDNKGRYIVYGESESHSDTHEETDNSFIGKLTTKLEKEYMDIALYIWLLVGCCVCCICPSFSLSTAVILKKV